MLCRLLATYFTMMLYCSSTTSTPSRADRPARTDPGRRAVISRPLRRTYLARGLTGRVRCPTEDDPPHRLVIWSRGARGGRVIQFSASKRFRVDFGGVLVIEDVRNPDAGDYRCTLYSPQDDAGRLSFVIRVIVRGQ